MTGQRDAWVTDRRTSADYAHALKSLSEASPEALKIVLIQDNLSTHTKSALYQAFCAEQAKSLSARFEVHFTPKHGSWLRMPELEWSALARQALGDCVGDKPALIKAVEYGLTQRRAKTVRTSVVVRDDSELNPACPALPQADRLTVYSGALVG